MVKLCAVCLIAFVLFNGAGPAILLLSLRAVARAEMKIALKNKLSDSELETIVLPADARLAPASFQRTGSHEFRYKGKLYDIVRSEQRGNSLVLRCINDVREERLLKSMEDLVRKSMNKKKSQPHPLRLAVKHLITHAVLPSASLAFSTPVGALCWHDLTVSPLCACGDVPTPPPRL